MSKIMYVGLSPLYWSEIDQYGDYNLIVNRIIKYMMLNDMLDTKDIRVQEPVERRRVAINNPDYEILIEGAEHNNELSLARLLTAFVEGGYGELECWEHDMTTDFSLVPEHKDKVKLTIQRNYYDALKCINVIQVLCDNKFVEMHCDRARNSLHAIAEAIQWKKTL